MARRTRPAWLNINQWSKHERIEHRTTIVPASPVRGEPGRTCWKDRTDHGRGPGPGRRAGTDKTLPIDEMTPDQWLRVIDTNLNGPFHMARHAAAHMRQAGGGHIINIASTAAKRAWPNASAYHASKWGLLGLSHALHAELREYNIKVTAVVAGGMRTPFLLDRFPDIDEGTLQEPADVAKAVLSVLLLPPGSVIAEITVLPMRETSWP